MGGVTKILDILITEDLECSILSRRHSSRAEAGAISLVDDDTIGSSCRKESEAVSDIGTRRGR